jgi:GNAT superfamily N-acetyltransferase
MTIREGEIDDAATIAKLARDLFRELGHSPPLADLDESLALCRDLLKNGDYVAFLSENSQGTANGVLTMSEGVSIYAGGRFGVIREFYVVPEMRSSGIGKALFEKAKEFSRCRGWKRIEATPPSKNEHLGTYRFYAREGFCEIGPRLKYEQLHAQQEESQ